MSPEPAAGTLVVGLGNTLMGDDGAGPRVAERLARRALPDAARAVALATDTLTLPAVWQGEPRIWLVDSVIRGAAVGVVHRLDHREVLALPQRHGSVHHLSLPESLRWLALAYPAMASVHYRLWGIEPGRVRMVETLSPPVAAAVERVADEIVAALSRRVAAPVGGGRVPGRIPRR